MSDYKNGDTASWDASQVRRSQAAGSAGGQRRPPQKRRRRRRINPFLYLLCVLVVSAFLAGTGWLLACLVFGIGGALSLPVLFVLGGQSFLSARALAARVRGDGKGRVRRHKSIEVTVPAGIDDEQILNVGGKGNAGVNGGPNGDLHVYVSVRPHPLFERRGNDVWCEMPITFTQAALGADVEVPTLDGKVSYHVHEGTQPGDVFRLKGKGIQGLGSRMRGDQYVQVTVEVPRNLSKRQKEILAELDKASDDKNYAKRKSFFGKLKDLFGE